MGGGGTMLQRLQAPDGPLTSHSHSVRMLRCRSVTLCCILRTAATEGRQAASTSRSDSSSYCRRQSAPDSAAIAAQAGHRRKDAARQAAPAWAFRPLQEEMALARSLALKRPRISTRSSSGSVDRRLERILNPPKPRQTKINDGGQPAAGEGGPHASQHLFHLSTTIQSPAPLTSPVGCRASLGRGGSGDEPPTSPADHRQPTCPVPGSRRSLTQLQCAQTNPNYLMPE